MPLDPGLVTLAETAIVTAGGVGVVAVPVWLKRRLDRVDKALNGHKSPMTIGQMLEQHMLEDKAFADEMRQEWTYQHNRNHLIASFAAKALSREQLASFARRNPTDPLVAEIVQVLGEDDL